MDMTARMGSQVEFSSGHYRRFTVIRRLGRQNVGPGRWPREGKLIRSRHQHRPDGLILNVAVNG